jgi:drug/metabolite transporter (DMT)-like permease
VRDRTVLLGTLAVVLAAGSFGLLGVLSRFSYDAGLEPLPFVAWRGGFGLLVVVLVVGAGTRAGRPVVDPRRLPRGDRVGLAVAALAALGLNVGMFFGFAVTTVAIVLLAFYTYPALVALVAVALGHERLDGIGWSALLLALGGMVLVVAGGTAGDAAGATVIEPLGVALGLGAAVCQTIFVTTSRGRFRSLPPEQAMAWVLLVTTIACAAAAVAAGGDLGGAFRSPRALGLVALAGVIAAGIPSILFLVGIRAIGGTRAGVLMLIEPLVGVTLAAVILGETLRPIQAVGGISILAGALLLQRARPGALAGSRPEPSLETIEPAAVPARDGG